MPHLLFGCLLPMCLSRCVAHLCRGVGPCLPGSAAGDGAGQQEGLPAEPRAAQPPGSSVVPERESVLRPGRDVSSDWDTLFWEELAPGSGVVTW